MDNEKEVIKTEVVEDEVVKPRKIFRASFAQLAQASQNQKEDEVENRETS